MLKLNNVDLHYGMIHALKGISLEVKQGEIVTLIGANGAGKTSTLRSISGLEKISGGEILYEGKNISHKADTRAIVSFGLIQVPEGRRIFPDMSVYENLLMGAYLEKDKNEIARRMEEVFAHFPRLKEREKQLAGTLSGGEQQMLAMGRALMANPKLLLLDEPSMGLAPLLVREIFSIIQKINERGTTILLVEQNARMALSIAHRAYVLENGKIVLSGTGEELSQSEDIKKAYLGG
ncbi:MAG: ABC transporter ATP-binding protein [Erysipelotrichaceae bacterium]|nr:ABC transporter ATP-binding protein [Erysipelotrichaceae bacterium]MBQ9986801.1 ABC transporter ATP-binding protein [Erysipelotrichales bacterium]MBR3693346.1 ABC transporter ATP-binding protein [Erysipelotrichales bacterium]